jgi:uncharacterized membrane protein YfcA
MAVITFIMIGAVAGIVMGMVGVGGGAIIIFSLLNIAGFTQKMAQGTTLMIVAAPVSLLAAYNYYQKGHVNVRAGLIVMVSFLVFSFIGSYLGVALPKEILKTGLGVILVIMGIKILFF